MKKLSKSFLKKRNAQRIAIQSLRVCQTNLGLTAGAHHFVDLWARDSLFATFGANVAGMTNVTRKTIATFLKYQRSDGLIPYRIQRAATSVWKYFGKPRYLPSPIANFRSHQSGGLVPDGGLLVIIAMQNYIERTGDRAFLRKHYPRLVRTLAWYQQRCEKGLVREWFLCEWADATLKAGKTLYTNVLYAKAGSDMSELAKLLGHEKDTGRYRNLAKKIQQQIQTEFWNGSYFVDWIDYKKQHFFASLPNMLAIFFDIAKPRQAASILDVAKKYCRYGFTLEENYPRYPFWRIPLLHYLFGVADYHNRGCLWLQPGILYAMALSRVGKMTEARAVLKNVAEKIIEFGGVYEVYEKDGRPVKRLFYESEHPFAWSVGLYLWAHRILDGS